MTTLLDTADVGRREAERTIQEFPRSHVPFARAYLEARSCAEPGVAAARCAGDRAAEASMSPQLVLYEDEAVCLTCCLSRAATNGRVGCKWSRKLVKGGAAPHSVETAGRCRVQTALLAQE